MAGLGRKAWTRERLSVSDLQGYLQDQVVMAFASVQDRTNRVPVPTEGMTSKLLDSDVIEDYVNGAWRRRGGYSVATSTSGTTTGTNNVLLAAVVVAPGRPYLVTVHASVNTIATSTAQGSLRIFDKTTSGTLVRAAQTIKFDSPDANISRTFQVTGGESRTFEMNLEVVAGSLQYFNNEAHSFLEATWAAL